MFASWTLSGLRELTPFSMALRLFLALLFGGALGLERGRKGRPAGFRTYMLVCLGASLTMLLSQYEAVMMETQWAVLAAKTGIHCDISRFGAQVINGIGFLGAGTVIVTGRQEVKGLTTAAGLWASACMGLTIGAGFYECTLAGFVMIFLSVCVFPKLEIHMLERSRYINVYMEFSSLRDIGPLIQYLKKQNIRIFDVDLDREKSTNLGHPNAIFSLFLTGKCLHSDILMQIADLDGICTLEEL